MNKSPEELKGVKYPQCVLKCTIAMSVGLNQCYKTEVCKGKQKEWDSREPEIG